MNANMKVSEQCRIAASKGNQVLGMIRRNITYKEKSLIIPLYKAIVRPHLEYCIQAWNPHLRKDVDGQGSQKLYNWQNIVSPPHYRNDVHHPHDIICLYCRGLQDESEYIYFYIDYVSHLSSIDEYCRTFGSNTVILACLQTNIAHSNLLHKKSINCNQTI